MSLELHMFWCVHVLYPKLCLTCSNVRVGPAPSAAQMAILRAQSFTKQLYSRVPVAYLLRFAHLHRRTFSQFFASLIKCASFPISTPFTPTEYYL